MLTRRGFLGSLIGGVAATAAVRTWPFRVFSFPSELKIAREIDFGYSPFSYGGLPFYQDKFCPPGTIYTLNINKPLGEQYRVAHPQTVEQLIRGMKFCRIDGLSC
jgi:hypothetical protein